MRADPDPPQNLNSKKRMKDKHREHRFKEGWVEFLNKKVARSVAEMLNANTIGSSFPPCFSFFLTLTLFFSLLLFLCTCKFPGGKKGSRWRDDVWTMKYLPRFRWDMLSEQVGALSPLSLPSSLSYLLPSNSHPAALERATQTSLLRFHLQHSRAEQESYLSAVEKSRVKTAMESKAEARRESKKAKLGEEEGGTGEKEKERKKERERSYRQREVVDVKRKGKEGQLEGVLDRLF